MPRWPRIHIVAAKKSQAAHNFEGTARPAPAGDRNDATERCRHAARANKRTTAERHAPVSAKRNGRELVFHAQQVPLHAFRVRARLHCADMVVGEDRWAKKMEDCEVGV